VVRYFDVTDNDCLISFYSVPQCVCFDVIVCWWNVVVYVVAFNPNWLVTLTLFAFSPDGRSVDYSYSLLMRYMPACTSRCSLFALNKQRMAYHRVLLPSLAHLPRMVHAAPAVNAAYNSAHSPACLALRVRLRHRALATLPRARCRMTGITP